MSPSAGEGRQEKAVLAMVFAPEVLRVEYRLEGDRIRQVSLRRLGAAKRTKSGLPPLRYAVLPFRGPFCLEELRAYDTRGRTRFDHEGCPEG